MRRTSHTTLQYLHCITLYYTTLLPITLHHIARHTAYTTLHNITTTLNTTLHQIILQLITRPPSRTTRHKSALARRIFICFLISTLSAWSVNTNAISEIIRFAGDFGIPHYRPVFTTDQSYGLNLQASIGRPTNWLGVVVSMVEKYKLYYKVCLIKTLPG